LRPSRYLDDSRSGSTCRVQLLFLVIFFFNLDITLTLFLLGFLLRAALGAALALLGDGGRLFLVV
jgi:hypothetical protein